MPVTEAKLDGQENHGLLRLIQALKRFLVSCFCLEHCRLCGRQLTLSGSPFPLVEKPARKEWAIAPKMVPSSYRCTFFANYTSAWSWLDTSERLKSLVKDHSQRYAHLLSEAVDFIAGAVSSEAASPALLSAPASKCFYPRFSDCLCQECWQHITIDLPQIGFPALGHERQVTLPVASGAAYEGKLKDLIGAFKYEGDRLLAADLACIMSNGWSILAEHMPASNLLIVPVPLHWRRKQSRGFNQAELVGRQLAKAVSVPLSVKAMKRTKNTRPQQELGRAERLTNLQGAFTAEPAIVAGKTIVLVDDVSTSGATLVECAKAALDSGAQSVAALTIAKAVYFGGTTTRPLTS